MVSALELHGVTKRYRAGTHGCSAHADALRGIDLCVVEGECVALVGSAGAGKSTLLFLAAGLLTPDDGAIRWFGDERRSSATARTSYVFSGARSVTHAARRTTGAPHIHLIDLGSSLAPDTVPRLVRWIDRRRTCGDAVVVAASDPSLGDRVGDRVVKLHAGRVFASVPITRVARVAERSVAARSNDEKTGEEAIVLLSASPAARTQNENPRGVSREKGTM
jgi:ABC-type polar amino acid transport system ATPase subunit